MARIQLSDFDDAVFAVTLQCPPALRPGAHTDNVQLFQLVSQARTDFFENLGYTTANVEGVKVFVGDQVVQYKAEAFPHQVVEVQMAVRDMAAKGFDLAFRMVDASSEQLIALGKIGIVCVSPESHRACPVPAAFLQRLEQLQPLTSMAA